MNMKLCLMGGHRSILLRRLFQPADHGQAQKDKPHGPQPYLDFMPICCQAVLLTSTARNRHTPPTYIVSLSYRYILVTHPTSVRVSQQTRTVLSLLHKTSYISRPSFWNVLEADSLGQLKERKRQGSLNQKRH